MKKFYLLIFNIVLKKIKINYINLIDLKAKNKLDVKAKQNPINNK